ncbi:ATP-binding protein [Clostridium nigeriense]|uniref:HAMP domain-containing sensor histidine kinase n=1 Tax=Clostridium nigeriense TaxID=1805470 RepID=UPI003D352F22
MRKMYNYFRNTLQGKIIVYFFTTILLSNIVTFFLVSPIINTIISSNIESLIFIVKEFHLIKLLILSISFILCVTSLCCISRRIVKQIKKLTKAMNEVSEGNFDIYLKTKEKDEIAQLIFHFNEMTRKLKNTAYIQKDFVNNISHELKTPIASIQGFAKILKNKNLKDEDREEYLNIIIDESKRLENLSSNILRVAKLENQDMLENQSKFLLDENIRKSILLLQNKWVEKNINFNLSLPKTYYYGDQELFLQVWTNIIENAIKFSNKNTEIKIKIEKSIDLIKIYIEDEGIGMTDEVKEYIFDKFYQEDNSRGSTGYGLGLAIAKRIVELSNGQIEVESEINKGSKFIISLRMD